MTRKPLVIASVVLNLGLAVAVVVLWRQRAPAPTSKPLPADTTALCDTARGDLDFFIEGLKRDQDPFYTPLVTRTLEPVLIHCLPHQKGEIVKAMQFLRDRMAYLVAENATPEQKAQAHDEVLRSFVHLRGYFDAAI